MLQDPSPSDIKDALDDNQDRIEKTADRTLLNEFYASMLLGIQLGGKAADVASVFDRRRDGTYVGRLRLYRKRAWNTRHYLSGNRDDFMSIKDRWCNKYEPNKVPARRRTDEHLEPVRPSFVSSVATITALTPKQVEVADLWNRGEQLSDIMEHIGSESIHSNVLPIFPESMMESKNTLRVMRCHYDDMEPVRRGYDEDEFERAGIARSNSRDYSNQYHSTRTL